jgi:hypothetical protein
VLTLLVIVVLHGVIPKDQPNPQPQRIDLLGTVLQAGAMISFVLGILLISDYGVLIARQPVVIARYGDLDSGASGCRRWWCCWVSAFSSCSFSCRSRTSGRGTQAALIHLALFEIDALSTASESAHSGLDPGGDSVHGAAVHAGVVRHQRLRDWRRAAAVVGQRDRRCGAEPASQEPGCRSVVRLGALVVTLCARPGGRMNTGTSPLDLALGPRSGFGNGLIGSQIVNLVLPVPPHDCRGVSANSTLEQVGNSVGVAILGTLLTLSLTLGVAQGLATNTTLTPTVRAEAQQVIEEGGERRLK